jgi:hypothetical protein
VKFCDEDKCCFHLLENESLPGIKLVFPRVRFPVDVNKAGTYIMSCCKCGNTKHKYLGAGTVFVPSCFEKGVPV